ncbi:MAG: 50S ribosomal protein L25 [Anaerolineae bacterium]|nr:50S ribosomal protein L25 [Anaerolineae bacterium]
MEKAVINATRRTVTGKKVGSLRREGKLPAVIYGHHVDATPITLDKRQTTRVLQQLTASSLVTINLEGKEHAALVREKQRDYILGDLLHVDFQIVSLTEKIRATVSVELTGTAPAVKEYNGIVLTGLEELEVESLPQDLPERFIVDISKLAKIGDSIHVRDIQAGDKVEILTDPDEMIVIITGGAKEEEITEEEGGAEEPEVIERGKKEEEIED